MKSHIHYLALGGFLIGSIIFNNCQAKENDSTNKRSWAHRLEIGGGRTYSWANTTQQSTYYSETGSSSILINDHAHHKSNGGGNIYVGYFFPIKSINKSSFIALSTAFRANISFYNFSYKQVHGPYYFYTPHNNDNYTTLDLPIGIDYRWGESIMGKKNKIFGTFGAGISPIFLANVPDLGQSSNNTFSFVPYIKGEVGTKVIVPVKLQIFLLLGSNTLSSRNYTEDANPWELGNGEKIGDIIKIKERAQLSFSLIFNLWNK